MRTKNYEFRFDCDVIDDPFSHGNLRSESQKAAARAFKDDFSRGFDRGVKLARIGLAATGKARSHRPLVVARDTAPELYDLTMNALAEIKEGKTTEWGSIPALSPHCHSQDCRDDTDLGIEFTEEVYPELFLILSKGVDRIEAGETRQLS